MRPAFKLNTKQDYVAGKLVMVDVTGCATRETMKTRNCKGNKYLRGMNAQLPPTYGMWHRSKPQQMPFTSAESVATKVYNCNICSRWTTDTISQRQLLKNKKRNPITITWCSRSVTKRNQTNTFAMPKTGKHADPYCFLNGGQSFLHGHTLHKHDLLRYWALSIAVQEML